GAAHFHIGRLDRARAYYERALAITATAGACSGAGSVLFFLGEPLAAIDLFRRGIALSPRDARVWGNLADAQRWTPGCEIESRESFDRAIALAREQACVNPSDAENLTCLALWLAKRGQVAESLAAIRQASDIAPEHPGVLGRAVSVHHLAGDDAR